MSNLQPEKLMGQLQPHLRYLSWTSDLEGLRRWRHRQFQHRRSQLHGSSNIITNGDLDDLKACIQLGFNFDNNSLQRYPKLVDILPALILYCAVKKWREARLSGLESDSVSSGSPIFTSGEDPEIVKTKLKQWAKVVACSIRASKPMR
ncbi:hypothetical protein M5689_011347 [Euphorbia peplus]|nr:hypothetical protein M5689_011347 [Euphorbia peplus]